MIFLTMIFDIPRTTQRYGPSSIAGKTKHGTYKSTIATSKMACARCQAAIEQGSSLSSDDLRDGRGPRFVPRFGSDESVNTEPLFALELTAYRFGLRPIMLINRESPPAIDHLLLPGAYVRMVVVVSVGWPEVIDMERWNGSA